MDIWTTWEQINQISAGRDLFLYGRSEDWVHKALPKLTNAPKGIVDRETSYDNSEYLGIPVMPLDKLPENNNAFFLITAGDGISGISALLTERGFRPGKDFAASPDFLDYVKLQDLMNTEERILFSSSDYNDPKRARGTSKGGGLYILDSKLSGAMKRVAKGSYRQFKCLSDGSVVAIDFVAKKLNFFDRDFNLLKSMDLHKANYCGLAISENLNMLSIVNAGTDEIETFQLDTLSHMESRKFSRTSLGFGHHLNDCVFDENGLLYCSFFSFSGSFKMGNYDGGVAAVRPLSPGEPTQLAGGLWKPHSPYVDTRRGEILVLDSMRGKLQTLDGIWKLDLPGFIRGLDEKNGSFAIGQSQNMYFTERQRTALTMVNAGIHLLSRNSNAYRFIPTDGIMNIHQVAFLDR